LAAAHCDVAIFATFAGQGADAARQGNLARCTYARRPKIHGFSAATVKVARARTAHRAPRTAHRTAPSHRHASSGWRHRARRLKINDSPAYNGVAGTRASHRRSVAPSHRARGLQINGFSAATVAAS